MGKFTDVKYVDSLVSATKSKLNNPYYKFSDQRPTKVTYYSQNIEQSTLDEASGLHGSHIGNDSPFTFNKITNFLIYGIERISTEYDVGDFGTESAPVTGNAVILPNTITPRPGDFFCIDYVKEKLLFKVNGSSIDTLDTGSNLYKIEYGLEYTGTTSIDNIEAKVKKTYKFIVNNVGTDFKAVIEDCEYELIEKLEALTDDLITCFEDVFFDSKLQTFVFNHDGWHMYDPFMIEFLIRNSVLSSGDGYKFVSHAASTHKTFAMDYNKTFFRSLEDKDINNINFRFTATADLITDPNSLFVTRMNDYYSIKYIDNNPLKTRLQVFDPEVIDKIKKNEYFTEDRKKHYNLWVSYFNNDTDFIRDNLIDSIRAIDYQDNLEYFYAIPISIFIIKRYMDIMIKK